MMRYMGPMAVGVGDLGTRAIFPLGPDQTHVA